MGASPDGEIASLHAMRASLANLADTCTAPRTALRECLAHNGIDVPVHERQGAYPSPTLVFDGLDVATGTAPGDGVCCRLDLPTHEQIHTALTGARG